MNVSPLTRLPPAVSMMGGSAVYTAGDSRTVL